MIIYIDISNKSIILFIKSIIILSCISSNINININYLISKINLKNGFSKNNKYLNLFNYGYRIIKQYKNVKKPKISIIPPIYNRGKYILRFLRSVQKQKFNDLEIIFIDDCSKDDSFKLIKEYKEKDRRIKLIKNIINKGNFVSRNLGVQYSLGNYVILPDPDDILSNNILNLGYDYEIKYNYEIIRFNIYNFHEQRLSYNKIIKNLENRPIYQPELSTYMFYGSNNELEMIDGYINNKFIKREVYIRSLNILYNFYKDMYITYMEDAMITFIIYRTAKSFFFLKKIGYYYLRNSLSINKNINKISGLKLKFFFIYIKIVFDNTKNRKYEKDMTNIIFSYLSKFIVQNLSILKYQNLIYDFINIFLNNTFFSDENKYILEVLKFKLKKNRKTII